jgi:hypothetical protein
METIPSCIFYLYITSAARLFIADVSVGGTSTRLNVSSVLSSSAALMKRDETGILLDKNIDANSVA